MGSQAFRLENLISRCKMKVDGAGGKAAEFAFLSGTWKAKQLLRADAPRA